MCCTCCTFYSPFKPYSHVAIPKLRCFMGMLFLRVASNKILPAWLDGKDKSFDYCGSLVL